jgi:UDP-N-acetylglucosamine 3-dehydrogenase
MIRVAVIGVGAMGRNHARVYREMPNAELVGIADEDVTTAQQVARLNNTTAYGSVEQLLEEARPEAVTVAVPTGLHFRIVQMALQAGSHVLVEKPIASTVEEGDALVALARDRQRILMVGHVERYNPAIIELKRRLEAGALGRIFQIHTRRLGPFPARVRDVGVVIDLATHDLDIMRYLAGSEATRVYAETRRQIHTSNEDLLGGLVHFAQDILGILEINWLTPSKIRELYVTGERGMFVANYLTQDLYFYENAEIAGSNWETLRILRGVSEGSMTRFALQRKEPLFAEQEAFLAALDGDDRSIVRGRDGLEALRLALALIESGQTHDVIHLATEPIC